MTTLTNLAGVSTIAAVPPVAAPVEKPVNANAGFQNVQSQKGFWRKILHGQSSLTFVSSTGGAVTISIADLWTLAETADAKLAIPVATTPAT